MATTVSQSIDDDDCGSFIVVQRWSNEEEQQNQNRRDEVVQQQQLQQLQEEEEQFTDAAANLQLDEITGEVTTCDETQSSLGTVVSVTSDNGTPHASFMSSASGCHEGEGGMTNDEQFSMTNYSTSSSTSEQQLEDTQAQLRQVIKEYTAMKENLCLELEQSKVAIEDLKQLAKESVDHEKKNMAEAREMIQKLTAERELILKELETLKVKAATVKEEVPQPQPQVVGFETLESHERQLRQRDEIIQQQAEQLKELSALLHDENVKLGQLQELLRLKEEEEKVKSDSLSSSDEALAKCLAEKERLEQTLEEYFKKKNEMQQEINHLREELGASLNEIQRQKELLDKYESRFTSLESSEQDIRIKLAALDAEKEQQNQILNQEALKVTSLSNEKIALQQEIERLNELLQARNIEIQNLQAQIPSGANPNVNSGMAGSFLGNIFNRAPVARGRGGRSLGIRDENDDPNEPFEDASAQVGVEQQPQAPPRQEELSCPICLKRFSDIRRLEFHASTCGSDLALNSDPFVFP